MPARMSACENAVLTCPPCRTIPPMENEPRAALLVGLEGRQRFIRRPNDGHAAGLAALGLVERDPRCGEIDALPLEPEDLSLPHPGVQRDRDDRGEVTILRRLARL